MAFKGTLRTCPQGHRYYKTTDCPTCPLCEQRKTLAGFPKLGAPARRALENAGIRTLKQLAQRTEMAILALHDLGPSTMPILHAALKAEGLSFKNKGSRSTDVATPMSERWMTLPELFADRALRSKKRVELLARLLTEKSIKLPELIAFAEDAKVAVKADCLEALERLTQEHSTLLAESGIDLCLHSLGDREPRVKWESARVIGNSIARFPKRADEAAKALLSNAAHESTVVRWSVAFALGRIILLRTPMNRQLVLRMEEIMEREEKNSIRKMYAAAIRTSASPIPGKNECSNA